MGVRPPEEGPEVREARGKSRMDPVVFVSQAEKLGLYPEDNEK